MRRMTVGMATMARRKTRFPTDIGSTPTEAKPTASVTAFCVYLIPLQHQRVEDDMHSVTHNRPTPPYFIYRAHLSAHPRARKSPRPGWGCTHHKQLFFYRRQPDFFLRPSAVFCSVVSSEVMPRMTVVVAVATRRKTCFPTVGGAIATKAKPSEDSTAFCVYLILMAALPILI